jgi:hypothetical protein
MAKRGGRSGRKYVRDSIGRFATTGATARGGRLKTKSGKKRATQTVKAKTGGKPAGTLKAKPKSEGQKYAKRVQAGKDLKRSQSTAREKKFFAETQKRLDAAPLAQSRAAKPAAAKRRGAVGKISEAKAGRIVARMDAQRGRKALPGRRNANFARTYERSRQFILKPSTAALKKGKPISVNESVQKAVANAAKRRKAKPAAAKRKAATGNPAAAKPAKRKTVNTSGASFERRRALAEPKVAANRRLKAEASRPLQFSGKKAGGKADQLFNDKVAQASYNRQRASEGVAARARRFYDGASQFYSAFSDRPRYSTIRKPAKDAGQWSSSSQSAWSNDLRKRRTGKRRRS